MTSQPGPGGQAYPYGQQNPHPAPPPTWPAPHEQHQPAVWSPPGGPPPPPAMPGQRDERGDRTVAAFGYLGMLVASIVIPFIFYLIKKNESPYLRHHTAQAINLSLTAAAYSLVAVLVGVLVPFLDASGSQVLGYLAVACLVFVYAVIGVNVITTLVFLIIAAVKASNGQYYRIPGWRCWRMVR